MKASLVLLTAPQNYWNNHSEKKHVVLLYLQSTAFEGILFQKLLLISVAIFK